MMFSVIVLFLFHCDSTGLAAARIEVRAFREQMIPAFAMDRVCCSYKQTYRFYHLPRQADKEKVTDSQRDGTEVIT